MKLRLLPSVALLLSAAPGVLSEREASSSSVFKPVESVVGVIAAVYDEVASAFGGDESEAAIGDSLEEVEVDGGYDNNDDYEDLRWNERDFRDYFGNGPDGGRGREIDRRARRQDGYGRDNSWEDDQPSDTDMDTDRLEMEERRRSYNNDDFGNDNNNDPRWNERDFRDFFGGRNSGREIDRRISRQDGHGDDYYVDDDEFGSQIDEASGGARRRDKPSAALRGASA